MIVSRLAIGDFMFTVTQLARKYDISRAAVLYYEREGLLMPDVARIMGTGGMAIVR